MPATREIHPVSGPIRGTIRPPGSKSLTNRALIVAALARGTSHVRNLLHSDDTRVMLESLARLGIQGSAERNESDLRVTGCGGRIPATSAELWLENSGTSIRFLTAACALGTGTFRLDGNARMRERPIAPLVDALAGWGVDIGCELGTGCPPVRVRAQGLRPAAIQVAGELSSQYLSALMMAAPCAGGEVTIQVSGPLVSRPYVDMTVEVMRAFGAVVQEQQSGTFQTDGTGYQGTDYDVEPDASAASYFMAAAAVTGGDVTIAGLSRKSLQGDIGLAEVLEQMGCRVTWRPDAVRVEGGPLRGIDVDMNAISDTAQTLAAVAPFAQGPTRIRNVAHMRHKETDRVAALVTELSRLGLRVEEHADGLTIHPGPMRPAIIKTYDDHRMAMSFAVLGLRQPGVTIADPGCTSKTYPEYFADLERLCEATT
ncbi:MAG: 3-phosphoshikimate 1-carboxyvinyltransferase [Planctomycetaceae bacterium]|nr:3-phosphoshikimate 1-carboxyvinyltransferase [Planctomycetaceae bacterium]